MGQEYKFKAWSPFEGFQTIAIENDFEAIMWGLNHQVDIFTMDDKLVYSPNDDEESNFERLEQYGVRCIDDPMTGRMWVPITESEGNIFNAEQIEGLKKELAFYKDAYEKEVLENADLVHFKATALKYLTTEQREDIEDEMHDFPEII